MIKDIMTHGPTKNSSMTQPCISCTPVKVLLLLHTLEFTYQLDTGYMVSTVVRFDSL